MAVSVVVGLVGMYLAFQALKKWLQVPSRTYTASSSVSSAYDDWTTEGVLEHYWGEHVHLGFYFPRVCEWFSSGENFFVTLFRAIFSSHSSTGHFQEAKFAFTEEMMEFARPVNPVSRVIDVGCGIGGSTRILARKFPNAEILGISISPAQIARARDLTEEAGITNAKFEVMDAMKMAETLEDAPKFDLVYVCESSEHMPDKARFFSQCFSVLNKGGSLVIAAWCCREGRGRTAQEEKKLRFLEEEWSHPNFASMEEISDILVRNLKAREIQVADWTAQTLPSWRHSIFVGIWNPWPVIVRPWLWLKTVREIYTIELMHRAFSAGLMQYGLFRARK